MTYDYVKDGAEIYRQSFATIAAEADLDRGLKTSGRSQSG